MASVSDTTSGSVMRPASATSAPRRPWKREPTTTVMFSVFGSGQQIAEAEDVGELPGGEPAALLDEHPAGPGQRPTEAPGADLKESAIQLAEGQRAPSPGIMKRLASSWPTSELACSRVSATSGGRTVLQPPSPP